MNWIIKPTFCKYTNTANWTIVKNPRLLAYVLSSGQAVELDWCRYYSDDDTRDYAGMQCYNNGELIKE